MGVPELPLRYSFVRLYAANKVDWTPIKITARWSNLPKKNQEDSRSRSRSNPTIVGQFCKLCPKKWANNTNNTKNIISKKAIKHALADVRLIFEANNIWRIFNLIDHNILKQCLIILIMYFGTLKAIFKAFYASFYFYNNKATFVKRISSAF